MKPVPKLTLNEELTKIAQNEVKKFCLNQDYKYYQVGNELKNIIPDYYLTENPALLADIGSDDCRDVGHLRHVRLSDDSDISAEDERPSAELPAAGGGPPAHEHRNPAATLRAAAARDRAELFLEPGIRGSDCRRVLYYDRIHAEPLCDGQLHQRRVRPVPQQPDRRGEGESGSAGDRRRGRRRERGRGDA